MSNLRVLKQQVRALLKVMSFRVVSNLRVLKLPRDTDYQGLCFRVVSNLRVLKLIIAVLLY